MGSGIHVIGTHARKLDVIDRGTLIGQKYRVTDLISEGATSYVYAATDEISERDVAIKVVRRGLGDTSQRAVDRLQLELFVYRMITSPHLPELLDGGRLPDGSPYMVLERVHGCTLAEKLNERTLSVPAVLEIGQQLLSGLAAAHRVGIIHRDIKPRNLLVEEPEGGPITLKVIDFGICSRARDADSSSAMVLGTPSYMSPEQIQGLSIDARTDLYSASVVLYEALTGRLPYQGTSSNAIMNAALQAPLLPPRVLRESCPEELEAVLLRGLSRNPADRFQSAEEMREALLSVVDNQSYASGTQAFHKPGSIPPPPPSQHADAQTERVGVGPKSMRS